MNKILWADDEIELLRPSILFLEQKGYHVVTATNGDDAIDLCRKQPFDLVFLDENMPGLSGLEALSTIKDIHPSMPVVMITKSEEEDIMDSAIGAKIDDYLIKPVRTNQLLLCLKKHIHSRQLVSEHTTTAYREDFADIAFVIDSARTLEEFFSIHRALTRWQLELQDADDAMRQLLQTQQRDANRAFSRFVRSHYVGWFADDTKRPLMSHDIVKRRVLPLCDAGEEIFFIVIDNFRYDQWRTIMPMINELFDVESEELYCSILPTSTQYARNAIFAGLLPEQIRTMYPNLWVDEGDEETKNQYEQQLLTSQLERLRKSYHASYFKINEASFQERVITRLPHMHTRLNAVVLNFIDMLSHSRTESRMMRQLAQDESAYLSLTRSWFRYSSTYTLFETLRQRGSKVVITTDHGTTRVERAVRIVGDRNTNTNLRYKLGKNLAHDDRDLFIVHNPRQVGLPAPNLSTSYVFATGTDFLVYPNNFNLYAGHYGGSFQHGGVSMEEMLVPLVVLKPKG